jgi:hypothetical protein
VITLRDWHAFANTTSVESDFSILKWGKNHF